MLSEDHVAKNCRWSLEAESGPQMTTREKTETSVLQPQQIESAFNLRELRVIFTQLSLDETTVLADTWTVGW